MNKVILFYKYIEIADPKKLRSQQQELCEQLGLKGRILIAQEGINGTLGGRKNAIDQYVTLMLQDDRFSDVDFKESFCQDQIFPKLKIKVRPEIVRLGIDPKAITAKDGGKHLTPFQTHELLASKLKNLVILDARNAFEAKIGKFVDAVVPDIEHFREFPDYIEKNLLTFKDKQVLMYCTGGIRCERASAFLKSKGVTQEVFQMEGGIHRYVEQYPDGFFRGKNYVFDGRIAMQVNTDVLSNCHICGIACDEYTNCINAHCNRQFIVCDCCVDIMNNTCSKTCQELVHNQEVIVRILPAKIADTALNK